ncbi:MAG TPA: putative transporter small subunit [Candidatus Dietzia intestinipullorum]|nr:putative transporter small subunit [Candidatus Dietzia merdigallinarum]HJC30211.1 putative transporter small subunit [Candidatus Dietzia intestinipullorum]
MTATLLTIYVLMWPVLVAGTLAVIVRGFLKEMIQAKRDGETVI